MATIAPDEQDFAVLPDMPADVFTAPLKRPAHVGEDWLDPAWFRLGASSLLNDLLMQRTKLATGRYGGPDYVTVD